MAETHDGDALGWGGEVNQQPEDSLPSNAPEFFRRYAGNDFLNDFAKKYSIEDATKMLIAMDDIMSSGDKKEILRAKDALSWSSDLRHDYFVNGTRENRYKKWAAQSPVHQALELAQRCIEKALDKLSERAATEGLLAINAALYAGVAVAASAMGLPAWAAGAIAAVPLAVRVAHECHEKYEKGKSPFETMAKLLAFAETPAALKRVIEAPGDMPLRKVERSIVTGAMAKEDVDGYREVARDRLKRTIQEMPASVKLLSHFKSLDELMELADCYQEKLKTVDFLSRDEHRRSLAIEAFKQTAEAKPGIMNVVLSKLMNDASLEGAADALTGIQNSISEKLDQRRALGKASPSNVSAKTQPAR